MVNHTIKMQRHLQFVMLLTSIISAFAFRWDNREKVRFRREIGCEFNLCNTTEGYPEDLIAEIAAKHSVFSDMYGKIIEPHKVIKISSRSRMDEENMCPIRSLVIFPTKALDINDQWKTIVNVDGYRQAVEFEACENNAKCFAEGKLPLGYRTSCEQQYITVRMIILDENEDLRLAKFPVPSGCACVYSFNEY